MKRKMIIGIDPDIDKSGVCVLYPDTRQVQTTCASFHSLLKLLENYSLSENEQVTVVVEASWMYHKTTNWHLNFRDSKNVIAAKGYNVGQNHQTGILICEMARSYGLNVVEHIPLIKCWKGHDRKITDKEIKQFMPIVGRTNQESRDAALLAWIYAGLPVRVKT